MKIFKVPNIVSSCTKNKRVANIVHPIKIFLTELKYKRFIVTSFLIEVTIQIEEEKSHLLEEEKSHLLEEEKSHLLEEEKSHLLASSRRREISSSRRREISSSRRREISSSRG
ncbi:hypothetical protein FF38_10757 [Lucilia cuprina]|uniref:Uncharacterized protein n=1 Tax=Lucilia cuprina TaxID=7375 RepID=A0A0L0C1B3_LUCCU|nr:hypothetical protein FF38_10757 [Lucilia cuprina]